MKKYPLRTVVVISALAVAGCGSAEVRSEMGSAGRAVAGTQGLFENIRARGEAVSRAPGLFQSPRGAMPQVRYSIDGRDPISVADAYVVGDFVKVEPGGSFKWTEDAENEFRQEVPFNAEDAQSSTIHLTLNIRRSIVDPNQPEQVHRDLARGNDVTLGLALGTPVNIDAVRSELMSAKSFAALLYEPSPVFEYDRSLWAIVLDGGLLGTVTDDRTVTFPALEAVARRNREDPDDAVSYSVADLERPSDRVVGVRYNPRTQGYERTEPTAGPS